ncbi:MAG: cytochrome c family protein [Pseudomonadota bacterium]
MSHDARQNVLTPNAVKPAEIFQTVPNTGSPNQAVRIGLMCLFAALIGIVGLFVDTQPATAKRLWVPVPIQKAEALNPDTASHSLADLQQGAKLFERCNACHAVGNAPDTGIGPHLDGIVGRRAASVAGYNYSSDMTQAGKEGLVWTREFLSNYLKRPESFLPETKMAFSGLSDADQRAALIAYLAAVSPKPAPSRDDAVDDDAPAAPEAGPTD